MPAVCKRKMRRATHRRVRASRRTRRARRQRGGAEHGVQFKVFLIGGAGVSVADHSQYIMDVFKKAIHELIQEGDINDTDIINVMFSYNPEINQFQLKFESTYQNDNRQFVVNSNIDTMFEAMEDVELTINGRKYDVEIQRLL